MTIDPMLLGYCQVFMTVVCGSIQLVLFTRLERKNQSLPDGYFLNMIIIGFLTSGVILCGLFALSYVAVSFAETVKSSAPIVTVVISWLILGERTPLRVNLSLLPVMAGLALCSLHELSFSTLGFLTAMGTNICECLQSVYVKKMITSKSYTYRTAELQLVPGLVSMLLQLPVLQSSVGLSVARQMSLQSLSLLALAGLFYYCQTATAYVLMEYISPVTYSVANTTKRALLIWLSVLLFHNQVTVFSGLGTAVVILGVLGYNAASSRHVQHKVASSQHSNDRLTL